MHGTQEEDPKFLPDGGLELRCAEVSSTSGLSLLRTSEQLNSGLLPTINEFYQNSQMTALILTFPKREHNHTELYGDQTQAKNVRSKALIKQRSQGTEIETDDGNRNETPVKANNYACSQANIYKHDYILCMQIIIVNEMFCFYDDRNKDVCRNGGNTKRRSCH